MFRKVYFENSFLGNISKFYVVIYFGAENLETILKTSLELFRNGRKIIILKPHYRNYFEIRLNMLLRKIKKLHGNKRWTK